MDNPPLVSSYEEHNMFFETLSCHKFSLCLLLTGKVHKRGNAETCHSLFDCYVWFLQYNRIYFFLPVALKNSFQYTGICNCLKMD